MPIPLPSKIFWKRAIILIGVLVLILLPQTKWFQVHILRKDKNTLDTANETLATVVTKDTNGNSIPDWEERLWGLDPTVTFTKGVSNKEIIDGKKRSAGIDPESEEELTETGKAARELFAITAALGQNGKLDEAALTDITTKIAGDIKPELFENRHTINTIKTVPTTQKSLQLYARNFKAVLATYSQGESEFNTLIEMSESGTVDEQKLGLIQAQYMALAEDLLLIKPPVGIARYHIALINDAEHIKTSLGYLTKFQEDDLQSLVGLSTYKLYSLDFTKQIEAILTYLVEYGIE